MEKTFVMVKPDGVEKNVFGKILSRFEDANLKAKEIKLISVSEDFAKKHYPLDEEWAKNAFAKTKRSYEKDGKEPPFKDHMDLGTTLQGRLVEFITSGPVIAMVLEGDNAISLVRELIGATEPKNAAPGTIRADFAPTESYALADAEKRAVRNLIHASDSTESAEREIKLWFNSL